MLELGNSGYQIVDEPSFDIWKYLNLAPGVLEDMYSTIIEKFNQSAQILSLT